MSSLDFVRIHDTINGVWLAPVIGFWDKVGYTRCLDCPPAPELHLDLIEADNSASDDAVCDFCGAKLHDARGVLDTVAEAMVAASPDKPEEG